MKPIIFLGLALIALAACNTEHPSDNEEMREIRASEIIEQIKKGEPVVYKHARITGTLDFTELIKPVMLSKGLIENQIEVPVSFLQCQFTDSVITRKTRKKLQYRTSFRYQFTAIDCQFQGPVIFQEARVSGALNMSQSIFYGASDFNGLRAKDVYFTESVCVEPLQLHATAIQHRLDVSRSELRQGLAMQNARLHGPFFASAMQAGGLVQLSLNHFHDDCSFDFAQLTTLRARENRFYGVLSLKKTRISQLLLQRNELFLHLTSTGIEAKDSILLENNYVYKKNRLKSLN